MIASRLVSATGGVATAQDEWTLAQHRGEELARLRRLAVTERIDGHDAELRSGVDEPPDAVAPLPCSRLAS
jgi:hypothetical protein